MAAPAPIAARLALALALLLPAAPAAAAELCRLLGQGQWGPIEVYTGPKICEPVVTAGDIFVVEGDVEVVTDLHQAATPNARIDVADGASLTIRVGDGPRHVVVGVNGFTCQLGSDCDFAGGFRAPRAASGVAAGDVVDDFAPETFWSFGDPVPCPGWDASEGIWQPDCGGTLADAGDVPGSDGVLGGHWSDADPERSAALAAMQPGEVWYFYDDDPEDLEASHESGFHYDVVDFASGGPAGDRVHLDVLQGGSDNGYAHARRRILACELAESALPRTRTVHTTAGCIGADFERDGQWLRFERNGVAFAACPGTAAAPCEAESGTVRIQLAENDVACPGGGTCDRFTIADLRGFERGHDAGGVLWISPAGPGAGDAGLVMVPVRFASATPVIDQDSEDDSEFLFSGRAALRAVVFDRTGGVRFGGYGPSAYGLVLDRFEDVFTKSPTHDGQIGLAFSSTQDVTIRRVTHVGGEQFETSGTGGGGNDHGIGLTGLTGGVDFTLEDVSVRYTWDDFIVTDRDSPPASLTLRRGRTQYEGFTDQTQSGVQIQDPATAGWIEDFECIDCADSERPISLLGAPAGAVRRVLFLAPKSDVVISSAGPIEDVTAIGARDFIGSGLAPRRADRCVIRDNRSSSPAALVSGSPIDLDHCWVRGNEVRLDLVSPGFGDTTTRISNSAFVDNLDVDGSGDDVIDCRGISGPGASCVVERSTVAYTPPFEDHPRRFHTGIRSEAGPDGREVEISETLLYGLDQGAYVPSAADATLERLCFQRNDQNMPTAQMVHVVDGAVGVSGLRDPATGGFDPLPGGAVDAVPCGIALAPESPGVCTRSWAHAVSGLEPECLAPSCSNGADDDFDGLRDHPEDPDCATPDDDSERPRACADGVDNDGDGFVDLADPGCPNPDGKLEDPICDDGLDNDGDGFTDFDDPDCRPGWPHRESAPNRCGLGPGLALVVPVLWCARRKRRRS